MVQIRKATPDDIKVLLPLVAAYWQFEGISGFDRERIAHQLERLLTEPHLGVGWVALEEKLAIGYLLAVYVFSLEHLGLTAEIDEFFVSPAKRNTGTGSALLGAAESEFTRIGCTNVSLQLSRGNVSARTFYKHHGYGERSRYELLDKSLKKNGV